MKRNPYEAGEPANIALDTANPQSGIHNGWVVGAISAGLLLLGAIIQLVGQGIDAGLPIFAGGCMLALICAGLAYGVYRKSRIAALILFVLFLALWVASVITLGGFAGVLVEMIRLLFAVMLYQAIRACFDWHRNEQHAR